MKECIYCESNNLVKNGIVLGKQRYKCKSCGKNPREGCLLKYSIEQKKRVIRAYTRGAGIRAIADIEQMNNELVLYWIKTIGRRVKELKGKEIKEYNEIEILEMDELWTYVGKKTEY